MPSLHVYMGKHAGWDVAIGITVRMTYVNTRVEGEEGERKTRYGLPDGRC